MRSRLLIVAFAVSCVPILYGCYPVPPSVSGSAVPSAQVVGDWTGSGLSDGKVFTDQPIELTLKSDGTGYWKTETSPEKTARWRVDGNRILLGTTQDSKKDLMNSDETMIGRISDDRQTITFDLVQLQYILTKQK